MRTLFILAFVLMQYGAMAADVPSIVEKNFKSKYPTATDVEWYDEEDGSYAAYFYDNDASKTAKFNSTGSWTETSTLIDDTEIPTSVTKSIKTAYANATINGSTLVEVPNALNQYEVSIEAKGSTLLLTYNEKGELLKKLEEVVESDDADDAEEDTSSEEEEEDDDE